MIYDCFFDALQVLGQLSLSDIVIDSILAQFKQNCPIFPARRLYRSLTERKRKVPEKNSEFRMETALLGNSATSLNGIHLNVHH